MRPFSALASLFAPTRDAPLHAGISPEKYFCTIHRLARPLTLYLAFVILAALAGPVDQFVTSAYLSGIAITQLLAFALATFCAATALGATASVCGHSTLRRSEWIALLALVLPQWFLLPLAPNSASLPALHLGWGTQLLLSLAAPLWLGLLSALGVETVEVPRAVIAAAILGIGAVCLSLPLDSTKVTWQDAPALLLNTLVGVAIVASWIYGRPRLAGCSAVSAAAAYLALSSAGQAGFAVLCGRSAFNASLLHIAWATLLPEIAMLAVTWVLWFWIFQRLSLAAFSMRMLAVYAATLLPGFFLFGLAQWRLDAAFVISAIALVVALRAPPAEEQPVSLGLTIS